MTLFGLLLGGLLIYGVFSLNRYFDRCYFKRHGKKYRGLSDQFGDWLADLLNKRKKK